MTLWKWSKTAANNSNADSTVNWAEGQAPSSVNDSSRAEMAAVAKYRDDTSGMINTGGSSTAFTITTNQVLTALTDGFKISARLHAANGASPTLQVDATDAKAIRTATGVALASGVTTLGSIYTFTYDSGDDCWYIHDFFSVTVTEYSDAAFRVTDDGDATKKLAFQVSGVTTGTTRTMTVPDASGTLMLTSALGVTALAVANNLSDVASAATAFSNIKQAASDTATGAIEIATVAEMVAATDVGRAVVPGRQHSHPLHPKAWGYATVSGGTPTLQASGNITSISDDNTGELTWNIGTDFSSAAWAPLLSGGGADANPGQSDRMFTTISIAAGSVRCYCVDTGQDRTDPTAWQMAGFGAQV